MAMALSAPSTRIHCGPGSDRQDRALVSKLARSAMDRLVRERSVIPGRPEGSGLRGVRVGTNDPQSPSNINSLEKGWRPVGDSNPCSQRERLVS